MAHGKEQATKGDHRSTKTKEELDIRHKAEATGREHGAMADTPDKQGVELDANNTSDPKPFPSKRDKSGPGRKFRGEDR